MDVTQPLHICKARNPNSHVPCSPCITHRHCPALDTVSLVHEVLDLIHELPMLNSQFVVCQVFQLVAGL